MCPSRHRRNNMSAKDGHVLLVMSTRGGGKVDTMFLLSAFSPATAATYQSQNLNTGGRKRPINNLEDTLSRHAGVRDRGRQSSRC